jgi:hypothetical protein
LLPGYVLSAAANVTAKLMMQLITYYIYPVCISVVFGLINESLLKSSQLAGARNNTDIVKRLISMCAGSLKS